MLLEVRDLHVEVANKEILKGIDLTVGLGEAVILMGPNGSGKSTLINTIMGYPGYKVTRGTIAYKGKDVMSLSTDERARLGIGISFQIPPKIRGISLGTLVKLVASRRRVTSESLKEYIELLKMGDFIDRDLNVGFSGGEMKRAELLLLLAGRPFLSLIDEPDSGVDVESIQLVVRAIEEILKTGDGEPEPTPSAMIVTHIGQIAKYLKLSRGYVMIDGRMACFGEAKVIVDSVMSKGFEGCVECFRKRA